MGTEMIKFPVAEPFHLSSKVSCGGTCWCGCMHFSEFIISFNQRYFFSGT